MCLKRWGLLLFASFGTISLLGQGNANKGNLSGLVLDAASAPVPDAILTAANTTTGAARETRSNEHGGFQFAALDPGTYEIRVDSGSLSVTVKNVTIAVGASLEVDVRLMAKASAEKVDIDTSAVSITDATAGQMFPSEAIRDLPIDGRRFQDFAVLAPTVEANAATNDQLSFLGQRGVYSNVMVDGSDYNEPFLGGIRGSDRAAYAFTLPQSAIQEFQVITTGYSPEYGRSSGGILNAITRSGGNTLHGEFFYQIRDQSLSLENPFGLAALEKQQQFGGSAGGAIKRNRLFWFAAAEGQLASYPRSVQFAQLDSITNVTPSIQPAYDYLRSLEGPFQQSNNTWSALARLDYQFRDASRLTFRFSGSQNWADNSVATGINLLPQTSSALSNNGAARDMVRTASAQYTKIFPPMFLNDLRVSYTSERFGQDANAASPTVELGIIGAYGTYQTLPLQTTDYRMQVTDSLTIQHGLHSFAVGADYSRLGANNRDGMNQYGAFIISSTDVNSILNILSRSGGPGGNRFDDPSVTYLRQVGNSIVNMNANQGALFAHDNWRVNPELTLNYGVRWEGQWNPSPDTSNSFLVNNVLGFPFPLGAVDPTVLKSPLNQWMPRAGLAWNVGASGKTIVRAGGGLLYAQTPLAFFANALNNFGAAGGDLSLAITPASGGTVYQQFLQGGFNLNQHPLNQLPVLSVSDVWASIAGKPNQFAQSNVFTTSANNFHNPRSLQMTGSIEHRFGSALVISYTFNHLNTVHLPQVVDYNVPFPTVQPGDASLRPFFGLRSGTPRPNPNLGAVYVLDSSARSTYTGNTFRAQYRVKRLQFMAQYTLSYTKSDGDLLWPFTTTSYMNPFNLNQEWGWSSLDARNRGTGYALYNIGKGFEVTGIFDASSGLPIDATTGEDSAQLLEGAAGNRPMASPGVPFPRNAFRNLGYKTVDVRLLKSFPIREGMRLQLSAEAFNLFNFANVAFASVYDYPNNPAFIYGLGILPSGQHAPAYPGFLQQRAPSGGYDPSTMVQQGPPLQFQLGARLLF